MTAGGTRSKRTDGSVRWWWMLLAGIALLQAPQVHADDQIPMEYGTLSVDASFLQVDFLYAFETPPIVVAKPLSNDDADPATVQIRNVTVSGFEIRVQEFDIQPDDHSSETVSFIAIAAGHYDVNGGELEAGATTASSVSSTTTFAESFPSQPVVCTSAVREAVPADTSAIVIRNSSVTTTQFAVVLQEQQVGGSAHPDEVVHYLAWTPGIGTVNGLPYEVFGSSDTQTHIPQTYNFTNPFQDIPAVIADMQTIDGGDPANVRITSLDTTSVSLFVAEELSDAEQAHTTERIGFAAIEEPTLFLHDGSGINAVAALEQVGRDVLIRFRVRNDSGNDVDLDTDSFEYRDATMATFVAIPAADISGTLTGLQSAADFSGPVHEITWRAANDVNLQNRLVDGLRVRFQVMEGASRSPTGLSPSGFSLDGRLPTLNAIPRSAMEDVPFVSSPITLNNPSQVTFDVIEIPQWLTFDVQTGQLSGTPTNADVGTQNVRITVTLGAASLDAAFGVTVSNTPPNITSAPPLVSLLPGDEFVYDVQSDDELSGPTRYSSAGPLFLTIDPATGLLSGTVPDDAGSDLVVDVSIDDGHGGSASQRFTLDVLAGPLAVEAGDGGVIAPGQPALLSATATGGKPPYRMFWSNGDEGDSTVVQPDGTTTYSAIVFDVDGRVAHDDTTVVVLDPLAVTVAGERTVVTGDSTTLVALVTGGMPPYDLLWSDGQTNVTVSASPVGPSTLSVTVIDAMGIGAVELVELNGVAPLSVEVDRTDAPSDGGVVLRAIVDGGLPPYEMFWSTGDEGEETAVNPGAALDVVLVVVDALGNGASTTATIEAASVEVPPADAPPGATVPTEAAPALCGVLGLVWLPLCLLGLTGAKCALRR